MRILCNTLLGSLLCIGLRAQDLKKLPAFGDVSKADLQMTECSFEKGAAAMVLFEECESVFRLNLASPTAPYFSQTHYRVRIKIFNQKGFDRANIHIPYPSYDKSVAVQKLAAQVYNLDASGNVVVTKVDKSSVYDKPVNARYSEKIFAFPDVKEGCVIEYKYTLDNYSRDEWYFQRSIPVQFSRFILDFPRELIVSVSPYCSLPLTSKSNDQKGEGNFKWYEMNNIPGLPDEPYMSCDEDYLQRLETRLVAAELPGVPRINLMRSWKGIVKDLVEDEDFGRQLKKDIPRTAELDAKLVHVQGDYERMRTIHKYVRENMEWNKYENIWALYGVKSVWKDKKGTSGEINLILINLLKDAGLKVKPILVSTRENGIINTSVAGFDQFNKVMAYVQIGESVYVLDATEKFTPSHLIPFDVMASEGLLIEKPDTYDWGWTILWDDKHCKKSEVFLNAEIDQSGTMKGYATVNSHDYDRLEHAKMAREGMEKLKETLKAGRDLTLDSLELENSDNDSLPLVQSLKFIAPPASAGDYRFFSVNYFAGLDKNPFVAEERASDIFFGVRQQYTINANVYLPAGYELEGLPKNVKMITTDTSIVFRRQCSYSEGLLYVSVNLEFKKPYYSPEMYPEIREFYKRMFEFLDEKFVYRKK